MTTRKVTKLFIVERKVRQIENLQRSMKMICSESKLREERYLQGLIHVTHFKIHTKVVKTTNLC